MRNSYSIYGSLFLSAILISCASHKSDEANNDTDENVSRDPAGYPVPNNYGYGPRPGYNPNYRPNGAPPPQNHNQPPSKPADKNAAANKGVKQVVVGNCNIDAIKKIQLGGVPVTEVINNIQKFGTITAGNPHMDRTRQEIMVDLSADRTLLRPYFLQN